MQTLAVLLRNHQNNGPLYETLLAKRAHVPGLELVLLRVVDRAAEQVHHRAQPHYQNGLAYLLHNFLVQFLLDNNLAFIVLW